MYEINKKFGKINPKVILFFCIYPFYIQMILACISIFLSIQKNIITNSPIQSFFNSIIHIFIVITLIYTIKNRDKSNQLAFFPTILIATSGIKYVIDTLVPTYRPELAYLISVFYISPVIVICYDLFFAPKNTQKMEDQP